MYLDTFAAQERVNNMMLAIRSFGHDNIPAELIDWQREDMHRHYPNVDTDQEYVSWFTLIWPRSRTYAKKTVGFVGKGNWRRHRKPMSPVPRLVSGRGAHRPILRPALFNRLVLRMRDLLGSQLSWTRTRGGPPGGPPSISSLGPQSARRISMLPISTIPTMKGPPPPPESLGPQTRRRLSALKKEPATPAPAPKTLGPQTAKRRAALQRPPAAKGPAPTLESLGPVTRSRLMKQRVPPATKTGKPPADVGRATRERMARSGLLNIYTDNR